jgi:hypothetical protein
MKSKIIILFSALVILANTVSGEITPPDSAKDWKISEYISDYCNKKFIDKRNLTSFNIGVAADPHFVCGPTSIRDITIWHAEAMDLTLMVGDMGNQLCGALDTFDYYVGHGPENIAWPYTGTVVDDHGTTHVWPDTNRPTPPILITFGNHEVHSGKRWYIELMMPGAVKDTSVWLHNTERYENWDNRQGTNGNGNYIFYSFNFGNLHIVALDPFGLGTSKGAGKIVPYQLKWLDADLHAHRHMETVVMNHTAIGTTDLPNLRLSNVHELMSILKNHDQVKWVFWGHDHGYYYETWAGINVIQTNGPGNGNSGAIIMEDGQSHWEKWSDEEWRVPGMPLPKDTTWDTYHRTLVPVNPSGVLNESIPDHTYNDNVPPGVASNLRLRQVDPGEYVQNSISLEWDTAAGADYYCIYRDGMRVGGTLYPYFTDYDLTPGTDYFYEIYARDVAGNMSAQPASGSFIVGNLPVAVPFARRHSLDGVTINVSPNPFTTSVDIRMLMRNDECGMMNINACIFDITGRQVARFGQFRIPHSAFRNSYTWDARNQPNGVYMIRVKTGEKVLTKRVVLNR